MTRLLSPADASRKYGVNVPEGMEAIYEPIYDFQTYDAAGHTQLTFFQNPIGQAGKTLADTNMDSAGLLPAPQKFLLQTVEVYLIHDDTPVDVSAFTGDVANDVYSVLKEGSLKLSIASKAYARVAPLLRCPPANKFETEFSAATTQVTVDAGASYAAPCGPIYNLARHAVPLWIPSTQNFKVELNWNTAVAITTGAKIGVVLGGLLYRSRQ